MKRAPGGGYTLLHPNKEKFTCPVCDYYGPFVNVNDPSGLRKHGMCPSCSSLERHRLLWLTLERLAQTVDYSKLTLLHVAPEPQFEISFRKRFKKVVTADLSRRGVDYQADLCDLPFADGSFDVVLASHVLEHITADILALENIRRILRPGGFALLPVPIIGKTTIEYAQPNAMEWDHVRAPGEDYFDRFLGVFKKVEKFSSSQFDERYQPYVYENRRRWPKAFSFRQTSPGERHEDVVPVCYV